MNWDEMKNLRVPAGTILKDGTRTLRHYDTEPTGKREELIERGDADAVPEVWWDVSGERIEDVFTYAFGERIVGWQKGVGKSPLSFVRAWRNRFRESHPGQQPADGSLGVVLNFRDAGKPIDIVLTPEEQLDAVRVHKPTIWKLVLEPMSEDERLVAIGPVYAELEQDIRDMLRRAQ